MNNIGNGNEIIICDNASNNNISKSFPVGKSNVLTRIKAIDDDVSEKITSIDKTICDMETKRFNSSSSSLSSSLSSLSPIKDKSSKVFSIAKSFDNGSMVHIFSKDIKYRNSLVEAIASRKRRSIRSIIAEDCTPQQTQEEPETDNQVDAETKPETEHDIKHDIESISSHPMLPAHESDDTATKAQTHPIPVQESAQPEPVRYTASLPPSSSLFSSGNEIPLPGESLHVDPLGSLNVPFDKVYELGTIINSGAFGTVYEAHHVNLVTKPVAVKVIERISKEDDEAVIKEALILRDILDLPNITALIDFYSDKHNMYMVQELAAGGDVFDRLVQKKIYTESDARNLARSLLTVVGSLHDRRLLHRDLKPENLLLKDTNDDTAILLCDFGYAKYLPSGDDDEDDNNRTRGLSTHCGTPAFTAPEIVEGIEYWAEVDMWSVGCIIFMLLAGCQPFQGENDSEVYQFIATGDYGFDEPTWDAVSAEAKSLISNLLMLDREQRFTAKQALASTWFCDCSASKLQSNDLTASLDGIKHYCEYIRPQGLHFICEPNTGSEPPIKKEVSEKIQPVVPQDESKVEHDKYNAECGYGHDINNSKSEVDQDPIQTPIVPTKRISKKKTFPRNKKRM